MLDTKARGSAAEAHSRLKHAYADRLAAARAHHAAGGAVVGSISIAMPPEIPLATGHMPLAIAPLLSRPTPFADPWTNVSFDPQRKAILDQIISGEVQFLEVCVNVTIATVDSHVYQAAKELLGRGEGAKMPPLHQYGLIGHRHPAATEYGLLQTHGLARRLRYPFGHQMTQDTLADAIETTNAVRAAVRKLNTLRRAGKVSGAEGLAATIAGRFMHPKDYAPTLTAALDDLSGAPRSGPRAIAICGWRTSETALHEVLEEAGLNVVGEDDTWGSRAGEPDIPLEGDLVQQIHHHHQVHMWNRAVYPASLRFAWVYEETAKDDVDVVVFYMPPSDNALGWDYPRLQDFVESPNVAGGGKKTMVLRVDVTTPEGRAKALSTTRHFIENL